MNKPQSNIAGKNSHFCISQHPEHPRLQRIELSADAVTTFLQRCAGLNVQDLEYVPFQRFTVASYLNDVLGKSFVETLRSILHARKSGGITLNIGQPGNDIEAYIKFSTAITHLIGIPNFDAMNGNYYARFTVKDSDDSDSYLRKAYNQMSLHTDGTYVKERTDWLLMMKLAERNAHGGRSRLIHLDDWEDLEKFSQHPLATHPLSYQSPPSKNVSQTMSRTTFFEENGNPCLCFIDQFAYPQTLAEAAYLHDLSTSMENSPATKAVTLTIGELVLLNNTFWVHGREAFEQHKELHRELLRQRGYFADTLGSE